MSADTKLDGKFTFTTAVRMIFGNVIVPKAFKDKKTGKDKGEAKFDGTFLLEPGSADLKAAKALAASVAKTQWPGRDLKELKFPFTLGEVLIKRGIDRAVKDGKEPRDQSFFEDHVVFVARSKFEVGLGVLKGSTIEQFSGDKRHLAKDKFYNGCYVVPSVNFVAYESEFGDGVNAFLDAVLWVKDGEKLGGTTDLTNVFKGYAGTVTAEDPGQDEF